MSPADYFGFLNGLVAVLFIAVLVIIFVSEYDRLRHEKS